MAYESILFQSADGIARITLNRPDRLNSFTSAMHAELREALAQVSGDRSVRVLLLTGAGRGFCAGQDLSDRAVAPGGAPVDLGESIENNYRPLVLALRSLPLPVVCAVNGVAAGAGANIALACDIVIATQSASFIQAFCKIGLIPDSGGTYFLPRLVGAAKALELLWTADFIEAPEAHRLGIVQRVVPDAELKDATYALARQIADGPQIPVRMIKRLVYQSLKLDLRTHLDLVSSHMSIVRQTADHAEGVAAFKEKRPANFRGK